MTGSLLAPAIRKLLHDRCPAEWVESVTAILSRWETGMSASFYQLGGDADRPVLECGAVVGTAVIDLTAQDGEIKTSLIPLHTIQGIQLIDKQESTEFHIRSAGTEDIRYFALGDTERSRLRQFASALEEKLR